MKLLIVGGGINSAVGRVHRDALSLSNLSAKIEAGCFSRNEKINIQSHAMWNLDFKLHQNAGQLLEAFSANAKEYIVLILTPTNSHYDIIKKSLSLGYSVISEKSITGNSSELATLSNITKEKGLFMRTTFNYIGYPMVRELKALVTEGYIGNIHQVTLEMPQEGLVRPPLIQGEFSAPQSWRLQDGSIPTVCLDLGVHLHHLLIYVTGSDPEPINATFQNFTQYRGIKDTMYCTFRDTEVGLLGSMWFTKSAIGTRNGMKIRIFGSSGSLSWYQQNPELIELALSTGEIKTIDRASMCLVANQPRYERMKAGHPSGYIEAFANIYDDINIEYQDWKTNCRDSEDTFLGINTSLKGLKFFEKCVDLGD